MRKNTGAMNVNTHPSARRWDDLPDPRRSEGGITLHEVGEIIRRLGSERGFDAVPEYRVVLPKEPRRLLKIDWVWLRKGVPYAAFEIEGCNAPRRSVTLDLIKLNTLRATRKVLVTYDIRFKDYKWTALKGSLESLKVLISKNKVSLVTGASLQSWAVRL
jgi:hypothetical protein